MVSKIIHIADLHMRLYKRHEEYREVFSLFFDEVKELQPDRIVIAGDLVHNKITMSPELFSLLTGFLRSCSKLSRTILIPGNHDFLLNNHMRMDAVSPVVEALSDPMITYYKTTGCYEDDDVVWCVYSLYDKNLRPDIDAARKQFGKKKKYIGIYHGPITGMKTDQGFCFDDAYMADNFRGLDYVLCGDIHRRQVIEVENTKVIMIGSMIQQDFAETITSHGYGLLDLQAGDYSFKDLDNGYGFYTYRIHSIEDIITGSESLVNK